MVATLLYYVLLCSGHAELLTPGFLMCRRGLYIPLGVGWGMAMEEGWRRSQPVAAGGTCAAAAFGGANAPRARARAMHALRICTPRVNWPPKLGVPDDVPGGGCVAVSRM